MAEDRKYTVELKSVYGDCDKSMFKKMAMKGDITSQKIEEFVNEIIIVKGYAQAHITTEKKDFNLFYFITDKGIISTGSEIFMESIVDYSEDTDTFKVLKIQTRQGHTYKAQPQDPSNLFTPAKIGEKELPL